jgi:outer membrane protein
MRQVWTAALVAGALIPADMALAGADGRGWFYEFGGASISFSESATISAGGTEIPGAGASLSDDVSVALGIGYFLTPEISLEAIIGAPPTTSITGTGTLAGLDVGEVTYGPAMLVANYTFRQLGRFQPLVGAGVTYTHVFDASGAAIQDLEVDDAMGGLVRLGFNYMVDDHQGLFVTVQRLFVDTTITGTVDPSIPGLGGAPASADIDLDPVIVFAGYTYRF